MGCSIGKVLVTVDHRGPTWMGPKPECAGRPKCRWVWHQARSWMNIGAPRWMPRSRAGRVEPCLADPLPSQIRNELGELASPLAESRPNLARFGRAWSKKRAKLGPNLANHGQSRGNVGQNRHGRHVGGAGVESYSRHQDFISGSPDIRADHGLPSLNPDILDTPRCDPPPGPPPGLTHAYALIARRRCARHWRPQSDEYRQGVA